MYGDNGELLQFVLTKKTTYCTGARMRDCQDIDSTFGSEVAVGYLRGCCAAIYNKLGCPEILLATQLVAGYN